MLGPIKHKSERSLRELPMSGLGLDSECIPLKSLPQLLTGPAEAGHYGGKRLKPHITTETSNRKARSLRTDTRSQGGADGSCRCAL